MKLIRLKVKGVKMKENQIKGVREIITEINKLDESQILYILGYAQGKLSDCKGFGFMEDEE